MMNDSISSPIFWMYFSYVLSFIIPLFCGLTLLTVKGAVPSEQATEATGNYFHILGVDLHPEHDTRYS